MKGDDSGRGWGSRMNIYLLTVKGSIDYDSYDAKVVRASSESAARKHANLEPGDEGKIWEDANHVDCQVLTNHGPAGVILGSYNAG